MRRALRLGAALCLAAAAVVGVGGLPAGAGEVADVGWWWKVNPGPTVDSPGPLPNVGLPQTPPETPAPPTVPEGGVFVSRDADGATAIGAVRFTLGEDEGNPVLELAVAAGGATAGEGDLLACQTGSAWSGAHGGRWDSKPLVECEVARGGGSVSGIPAEDGSTWTFNLGPLLIDGPGGREVDVAIVPTVDPEAPAGAQTPFQVTFDKVSSESLKTESGGGGGAGGFPSPSTFAPGGELSPSPAGGTDFSTPFTPEPSITSPALGQEDQGISATAPSRRNATTPALGAAPDDEDEAARVVAIAVLLAGAAAMYWASRQQLPALAPLTRMSGRRTRPVPAPKPDTHVGGLGRFARPRAAPPQPL